MIMFGKWIDQLKCSGANRSKIKVAERVAFESVVVACGKLNPSMPYA